MKNKYFPTVINYSISKIKSVRLFVRHTEYTEKNIWKRIIL